MIQSLPLWAILLGAALLLGAFAVIGFIVKSLVKMVLGILALGVILGLGGYFYFFKTEVGMDHWSRIQQNQSASQEETEKGTNVWDTISNNFKKQGSNLVENAVEQLKKDAKESVLPPPKP